MKKVMTYFLTVGLFFITLGVFAQTQSVSGTVTDSNGEPVIAATVRATGTNVGAVTDLDGNFSLQVPSGTQTLTISYVGKETQIVPISGGTINVSLADDDNLIEGVVVTALGIERKPRDLSYSVSNLQEGDINKTSASNVATALVGKVSGLQINTTNNGVNPSTRVVLRGSRSVLGDNEALIVIDGYPASRGALDRINPNDIESVTVLKGANASAIYGSDASNGALVIKTKRGNKPGLNVEYIGNFFVQGVSFMPKFQDKYGSGGFPDGTLYPLENVNWGPAYDGRLVDASETYDDGRVWQVPFTPIKNNHRSFFNNQAPTFRNGITLTSGGENEHFYLSVDHLDTKGIVPKDKYNQTNVRLKADKQIDKLTVGGNFSFFRNNTDVVGNGGRQGRPLYWNIINTPFHIPITKMKNWRDGEFTRNEVSYYAFYENPYFIIDTQREKYDFNEFTAIGDISYKFTDYLSLSGRAGYTNANYNFDRQFAGLTYDDVFVPSHVYSRMQEYGAKTSQTVTTSGRLNTDLFLQFNKELSSDLTLDAVLGQNYRTTNSNSINVSGGELIIPDFYNVSTRTGELAGSQSETLYRKLGAYTSFDLGFRDYLFFNFTGRNDWSSTLPKANRSYFYPGGGVAFILSDALPSLTSSDKGLSFLKTSMNIAKTGRDPGIYQTSTPFSAASGFPFANTTGLSLSSRESNPNLNPEFTTALEAGLEVKFYQDRFGANFTAYQTNTTDQIIPINTSFASGATSAVVNLGEVQTKGIELDFFLTPIEDDAKKMYWDINLSYGKANSEVLALKDGVDEVNIGGYSTSQIVARVGQPFPLIRTTAYERDPDGRVIVGADGDPIRAASQSIQGQTTPKTIWNLNTNFKVKNWNFYMAGDYRTGHVFFNDIVNAMEFTGLTQHSASSGRRPFVFPNSSYLENGVYVENTNRLTSGGGNAFWDEYNNVKENYVTDATVLKIREVSASYDFPAKLTNNMRIQGISIGAYGRNLFTRLPADNVYTDPEFNFTTGNAVGVGTQSQTPPTRIMGLNLNVKF